jgi:hypothetical protein
LERSPYIANEEPVGINSASLFTRFALAAATTLAVDPDLHRATLKLVAGEGLDGLIGSFGRKELSKGEALGGAVGLELNFGRLGARGREEAVEAFGSHGPCELHKSKWQTTCRAEIKTCLYICSMDLNLRCQ